MLHAFLTIHKASLAEVWLLAKSNSSLIIVHDWINCILKTNSDNIFIDNHKMMLMFLLLCNSLHQSMHKHAQHERHKMMPCSDEVCSIAAKHQHHFIAYQ